MTSLILISTMGYKKALISLSLLLPALAQAQFRLPQMDVEVKFGQSIIPASGSSTIDNTQTTNVGGALNFHISQHVGVGWYYQRSLSGSTKYQNNDGQSNTPSKEAQMLLTGPVLRISTGRGSKWRPYIALSYSKMEIVQSNGGYNVSSKTNALGVNIGVMRRLGNRLYLNLIEVGGRLMNELPFWYESTGSNGGMIEAKTGLTYNFGKRK